MELIILICAVELISVMVFAISNKIMHGFSNLNTQ